MSFVLLTAQASGGAAHKSLRNLAGTVTAIKAGSGNLYGLQVFNASGATAYVQLFDVAAASVSLGTTTPDMELLVANNSTVSLTLPATGVYFANAISAASATAEGGGTGSASGVMVFAQYA